MGWLVGLVLLGLPFILRRSEHVAARVLLTVFWIGCLSTAVWLIIVVRMIEKDIHSVREYALPNAPGSHSIKVARTSQGSMKGVLRGGAGVLPAADLERFRWAFAEPDVPADWFKRQEYDGPEPGETLLFYIEHWTAQAPVTLTYTVQEANAVLLAGRTLVVGHDRGAKHLLRDHAQAFLEIYAGVLIAWGGLWMIVQIVWEVRRRRSALQGGPRLPS